jgi:hypothetical protein
MWGLPQQGKRVANKFWVHGYKYRYKFKGMTTTTGEWTHIISPIRPTGLEGGGYCTLEVNGLAINPPQPLSCSLYYMPCYVSLAQCSAQNNDAFSATVAHVPNQEMKNTGLQKCSDTPFIILGVCKNNGSLVSRVILANIFLAWRWSYDRNM